MIVVIDYNVGNVKSVCNAFRHIGCDVELSRDPKTIDKAAGLVLPGVAAFGYAMEALGSAAGLVKQAALAGKPTLGICVGYQMLFEESTEYGPHKGLGLIGGRVVPLPTDEVVPHMGWNRVELPAEMNLFSDLGPAKHFYFAHSYYAPGRRRAGQGRPYRLRLRPARFGPEGQHLRRPVPSGKKQSTGIDGPPEF